MGWFSGKQPVYKFNPLKISKSQQTDFLKSHMKMTDGEIKRLKTKVGDRNFLKTGKALSESQWRKVLREHDKKVESGWSDYRRQQAEKYEDYQAQLRKENIKKTQKLDRRKEAADTMIRKLTGRDEPLAERLKKRRPQSEGELTAKEKRAESMRNRFINLAKPDWQHAGPRRSRSIYEVKAAKEKGDDKAEDDGSKNSEDDDDVEGIREQSKNLPDLQI